MSGWGVRWRAMTLPGLRRSHVCVALALALGGLACTIKADACDEQRMLVDFEAEAVVADFVAAPTPTLSWLDTPILDDGWGVSTIDIDHAGICTTPLHVDIELRDDDAVLAEPELGVCGPEVLLVPVHISITSEDGIFALDTEGGIVGFDEDAPGFTVILDAIPEALSLQIGPASPGRTAQLLIEARLVEGQLEGQIRLISHDCRPGADCSYWAEHILASFE